MKQKGLKKTPQAVYNEVMSELAEKGAHILSLPRNPKLVENTQLALKMAEPGYKPTGNTADQVLRVWNMVAEKKPYVRRISLDSDIGLPEVYIR